jgi:hypothetical protein
MTMTGTIRELDGPVLKPGALFSGSAWLDLPTGASATFRHVESTREWTLIGPGRMRPCRDGGEQIGVATGRVKTTAGAGARPGADVLIFSPHGVLHYGDATLEVRVDPQGLRATARSGEVWLETLEGGPPAGPLPLGRERVAKRKGPGASLEQRCESLAQRAAQVGTALVTAAPNSRSTLSTRAVEHLKARRDARSICGIGESFAASLEPPERGRLLDRFAELERISRSMRAPPSPSAPQGGGEQAKAKPSAAPKP